MFLMINKCNCGGYQSMIMRLINRSAVLPVRVLRTVSNKLSV